MALLNALFLLLLCGLLYLIVLGVWILFLFLFCVRRKFIFALLSLPVYLLALTGWFFYATRPAAVFESSFGIPPPPDVTDLQSSQWILGDSGTVYLRFRAAPQTIDRIVSLRQPPPNARTSPSLTNAIPPRWWRPLPESRCYPLASPHRSFASEEEFLYYDPATREAHYSFLGID